MANISISLPRTGLSIRNISTKRPCFTISASPFRLTCSLVDGSDNNKAKLLNFNKIKGVACGILAAYTLTSASFPVTAATQRLRHCQLSPIAASVHLLATQLGKTLSAALMSKAKFDGADMTEVVMSKAYAVGGSFRGVDFSNAVLDRVNFGKADLEGAVFRNTVLSGSTFDEAKLDGAVFEDTIIGYIDLQKICRNTTISDEGRAELGCR
ncbi:Tetratricopeptide repeat (TPR) superfamily protein [Trifolium repens]|nr:Tetratricopeptide repeat (TPR) superfamily protein [Trifolium repens]